MKLFYIALIMILLSVNISYAYMNSTIICISNNTLQENWTVVKDGNQTNLTLNTWCAYNCDNVTMSCNPPDYISKGSVGIVIIFVVVLFFIAYKKIKKMR